MALKYRDDKNLDFLQFCEHDDLSILRDYLLYSKDKEKRLTEMLTLDDNYSKNSNDLTKVWDIIGAQFQRYGADSIATLFRGGKGVEYKLILKRVCKKYKVNFSNEENISKIEDMLLLKVIKDNIENLSKDEQKGFAASIGLNISKVVPGAIMSSIQTAINTGGFASYKLAAQVANQVAKSLLGRGLTFTANQTLMKSISIFAGPIGWLISAITAIPVITGPAYRILIPATFQICYMRKKYINKEII